MTHDELLAGVRKIYPEADPSQMTDGTFVLSTASGSLATVAPKGLRIQLSVPRPAQNDPTRLLQAAVWVARRRT